MLRLAEIFQDGMVLQRNKKVRLWGITDQAQTITAFLNGEKLAETQAGEGEFALVLPAREALEDGELRILGSAGEEVVLREVDFGEVWIAGGQSNMEFLLKFDREADAVIEAAEDPHFRFYDVGKYAFEGEKEEGLKDGSHWDRWMKYVPEEAPWFSAVGTYFALRLREKLQVPVGVVGCNWGGTSASAWVEEELLREDSKLRVYTDDYDKAVKKLNLAKYEKQNFKFRQNQSGEKARQDSDRIMKQESLKAPGAGILLMSKLFGTQPMGPHDEHRPGGLYRTMQQKIAGYACQGVIWYQGESDDIHARLYKRLFETLIDCWRRDWGEQLPFLFVQLAPFEAWMATSGKQYPMLRHQQQKVEDTVPRTWMASIMDVGSRYDIHPKDKRPVGERLALLALHEVYGGEEPCLSPRVEAIYREDGQIRVAFAHAENGLEARGEIAGLFRLEKNRKPIICEAAVGGSEVVLTAPELAGTDPVWIAFAYEPYCEMKLYSREGLPARPFAPRQAV